MTMDLQMAPDLNVSAIYKIENEVNGMVYVGSAKNFRKRRNGHLSTLRRGVHKNSHLQYAYDKYGISNFTISIIEEVPTDELIERETYWIEKLKANDRAFGYNKRIHTDNNVGITLSDETRRRISASRTGKGTGKRDLSPEVREFMRDKCISQNLRQYHTEDVESIRLQRLREATAGVPISEEHRECISKANRGTGNGMARLDEEKVIKIKRLLDQGEKTQTEIAEMFGVSRRTISFIKTGERWGHVRVS